MTKKKTSTSAVGWRFLFHPVPSKYFQVSVASVWLTACLFCLVYIWYGPSWHKGVATPSQAEYDSALLSFLGSIVMPAITIIGAVFGTAHLSGQSKRGRILGLLGVISVLVLILLCFLLCSNVRQIIVYDNYEVPQSSGGMLKSWEATHPWDMRLVPRIQGLCTFYGWLLTIFLSLGLFPVYQSGSEE